MKSIVALTQSQNILLAQIYIRCFEKLPNSPGLLHYLRFSLTLDIYKHITSWKQRFHLTVKNRTTILTIGSQYFQWLHLSLEFLPKELPHIFDNSFLDIVKNLPFWGPLSMYCIILPFLSNCRILCIHFISVVSCSLLLF